MPPGRPRRRNKTPAAPLGPGAVPPHQYRPPLATNQPPPRPQYPRPPMREEPTNHLHDEADLISFRNDALARFITNQELLENVTSKFFHTSKIAPPASFPAVSRPENLSEATFAKWKELSKGEDVYFGDIAMMRLQARLLDQEHKKLDQPITFKAIVGDQYAEHEFHKRSTDKLARLMEDMDSADGAQALEKAYDQIVAEYREKFHKQCKFMAQTRQFAVPAEALGVDVQRAPDNYNPRSVASLIDMNKSTGPHGDSVDMMPQYFNGNGMEFLQFDSKPEPAHEPAQARNNPPQSLMPDMALDIEDMGDLINFQGDDDNIIAGQSFDDDFLSQIDHSLE